MYETLLRAEKLDQLRTNAAIQRYNGVHLATSPLSGSYPVAPSTLEAAGFVPPGAGYDRDAWGDPYTGNPPGATPMTAAMSVNVAAP